MLKLAWLADCHLSIPDIKSQSLWPNQMRRFGDQGDAVYQTLCRGIQDAFESACGYMEESGPWDFAGVVGDWFGAWQEKGCFHPRVKEFAKPHVEALKRSVGREVLVSIGNHESGYRMPVCTVEGAGMREDSIEACRELFGELWWSRSLPGLTVIGVCSPLASYTGDSDGMLAMQHQQAEMVADTLRDLEGGKWILASHEIGVARHFSSEIHGYEQALEAFVIGGLHDPRKHGLVKRLAIARNLDNQVARHCISKSILCPSTAPLWWSGYGMLRMEWEDQQLTTVNVNLPRCHQQPLPTESFWTCLKWGLPWP